MIYYSDLNKWDKLFIDIAIKVSNLSKDPSTKVGCVIAKDTFPISFGYNGIIRGIEDTDDILYNRELKLAYSEHAERNAIFNACRNNLNVSNSTLYSTHYPCHECARAITQSGINKMYYLINEEFERRWKESADYSIKIIKECNLKIFAIKKD